MRQTIANCQSASRRKWSWKVHVLQPSYLPLTHALIHKISVTVVPFHRQTKTSFLLVSAHSPVCCYIHNKAHCTAESSAFLQRLLDLLMDVNERKRKLRINTYSGFLWPHQTGFCTIFPSTKNFEKKFSISILYTIPFRRISATGLSRPLRGWGWIEFTMWSVSSPLHGRTRLRDVMHKSA